jgi:hypothetical protein
MFAGNYCSLRLPTIRSAFAPRCPNHLSQHARISRRESYNCAAALSPCAVRRREDSRMRANHLCLLFTFKHHHSKALVGITKSRKNPSADSKIRVSHVRTFRRAIHAQCDPPKFF